MEHGDTLDGGAVGAAVWHYLAAIATAAVNCLSTALPTVHLWEGGTTGPFSRILYAGTRLETMGGRRKGEHTDALQFAAPSRAGRRMGLAPPASSSSSINRAALARRGRSPGASRAAGSGAVRVAQHLYRMARTARKTQHRGRRATGSGALGAVPRAAFLPPGRYLERLPLAPLLQTLTAVAHTTTACMRAARRGKRRCGASTTKTTITFPDVADAWA